MYDVCEGLEDINEMYDSSPTEWQNNIRFGQLRFELNNRPAFTTTDEWKGKQIIEWVKTSKSKYQFLPFLCVKFTILLKM